MNAKNIAVRVALLSAAVISTSLTLGSVVALANHYGGAVQQGNSASKVVARR